MPRPQKGPRLYLRKERVDGKTGRKLAPIYFIRDGQKNLSTGCGPDRIGEAEAQLTAYLLRKAATQPPVETDVAQSPAQVLIADVIQLYATEKAPTQADPTSTRVRLTHLLDWWGERTLAAVRRSACGAYVAHRCSQPIRSYKNPKTAKRVSAQAARRELEDLAAAIGYWHREHPLSRVPVVTLPDKALGSRDALSRSQAAALLLAAMGFKREGERWKRGARSTAANRRHLRRFVLLGLYTGTRPGVLPKLLWEPADDAGWIDVDKGWIYRRGREERHHPTKRRPMIRIPGRLLPHLRRWRDMDQAMNIEREAAGLLPVETVLHHGGRSIAGRIRKGYAGLVAHAGLNPDITPHWHRHTAATWLMEKDVPPHRAAQYLGMTVATLEKHYGHNRPDYQADVGAAISKGGRS